MIAAELIETLAAVERTGSMSRAATALRITQSAVSKRIAALEADVARRLVERDGRRVKLTPAAHHLLQRTRPLLAELRDALRESRGAPSGELALGVSESLLASWAPRALARALRGLPEVTVTLHAHRSPVAVDAVRSGEYLAALVAGCEPTAPELAVRALPTERMVVVTDRWRPLTIEPGQLVRVATIEPRSATWESLAPRIRRLSRTGAVRLQVTSTLQSFAGLVQLARGGFGHALVPEGIARALGAPARARIPLPEPGLERPLGLVTRRATADWELVKGVCDALEDSVRTVLTD